MFDIVGIIIIVCVLISLIPASISDYRTRTVPVSLWKPAAYVSVPLSFVVFGINVFTGVVPFDQVGILVIAALATIAIAIFFGMINVFGGADSIAISIIALTTFGMGVSYIIGFLINMAIICVAIVVGVFVLNMVDRALDDIDGRWYLMFIARRLPITSFGSYHGILLEEVWEDGDVVNRSFVRPPSRFVGNERTTSDIAKDDELMRIYGYAEKIWVMYIIPFIIPITISYIVTLVYGNLLGFLFVT